MTPRRSKAMRDEDRVARRRYFGTVRQHAKLNANAFEKTRIRRCAA
jgi:hypothetical protein